MSEEEDEEEGGAPAPHRSERVSKKKLNDIRLIQLVRAQPPLYEVDDADYRNQMRREEIWQDIAKQMRRKLDDCRRRWFNIRDCFRKALVKRQNRSLEGDFTSKPIRFEKELSFMVPHLRGARKPRKRFASNDDTTEDDPLTSVTQDLEYVEGEAVALSPEAAHTMADDEPIHEGDVEAATEIHDILQELVSWRREEQRTKRDHIGTYFKSIEETVRTLPWALQIEAKKKISSLVFDLELKSSTDGQSHYDAPESSSAMKNE